MADEGRIPQSGPRTPHHTKSLALQIIKRREHSGGFVVPVPHDDVFGQQVGDEAMIIRLSSIAVDHAGIAIELVLIYQAVGPHDHLHPPRLEVLMKSLQAERQPFMRGVLLPLGVGVDALTAQVVVGADQLIGADAERPGFQ